MFILFLQKARAAVFDVTRDQRVTRTSVRSEAQ